jgi:hypothetical protein
VTPVLKTAGVVVPSGLTVIMRAAPLGWPGGSGVTSKAKLLPKLRACFASP